MSVYGLIVLREMGTMTEGEKASRTPKQLGKERSWGRSADKKRADKPISDEPDVRTEEGVRFHAQMLRIKHGSID